jgi:hypothetical protein
MRRAASNWLFGLAIVILCGAQTFAGDCGHPGSGQYGQSAYSYNAFQPMTYAYSSAYTYPATYANYGYTYPSTYPANYSYNYSMPAQTMNWQPMVLAPAAAQYSGSSAQSASCSQSAAAASADAKGSQGLAQAIEKYLSSGKFSAESLYGDIDREPVEPRDDVPSDVNARLDSIEARLTKVEQILDARNTDHLGNGSAKDGSRYDKKQLRKFRKKLDGLDSKVKGIDERTELMYGYLNTLPAFQEFAKKPE